MLATTDNQVAEGETRLKRGKSFAIRRFSSFLFFVPIVVAAHVRFLPEEARQFRCITGGARAEYGQSSDTQPGPESGRGARSSLLGRFDHSKIGGWRKSTSDGEREERELAEGERASRSSIITTKSSQEMLHAIESGTEILREFHRTLRPKCLAYDAATVPPKPHQRCSSSHDPRAPSVWSVRDWISLDFLRPPLPLPSPTHHAPGCYCNTCVTH